MVRTVRQAGCFVIIALALAVVCALLNSSTSFAEDANEFPFLTSSNASVNKWDLGKISPDTGLTWLFRTGNADPEQITGKTSHILRNRSIGRNEGTRLRVYFKKKPQKISVTLNVIECELDAPWNYRGDVIVKLGGVMKYQDGTYPPRKVDHLYEIRDYPGGNQDRELRPGSQQEVLSDDRYGNSPVCKNYGNYDVPVWAHKENCAESKQLSGGRCENNGTEEYTLDKTSGTHTVNPANTKLDGRTFEINYQDNYNPDGGAMDMGRDPLTGLYFADLDIDLTAVSDPYNPGEIPASVMQRMTFTVEANNVVSLDGGTAVPSMGYRTFNDETNASRFFGLEGNGGRAETFNGYGQKLAIPFGMDCNDTRDAFWGKMVMYDPDVEGFGPVYMKVLKRNPDNGNVTVLNHGDYQFNHGPWRTDWQGGNKWIRSTAGSNENSAFNVRIDRGFQYMFVSINPHNSSYADPSFNVYSMFLPTNSINGLINCRFDLRPSMSGVKAGFSYTSTLNPRGRITNAESGSAAGDHEWRITRAIFDHKPADLSRTTYMNSGNGISPCEFIENRSGATLGCGKVNPGTYTFPDNYDETLSDTVSSQPVGTYVCYIASVFDPTWLTGDDSQWRHSAMQCSVSGISPKLQAWGYDIKARGKIAGTTGEVSGTLYGSWGEYAVLSNGRNNQVASGNGMFNAPGVSTQPSWSNLTFAQGTASASCGGVLGAYGCYGAVSKPFVPEDGATVIDDDADLDSLDTDTDLPPSLRTGKKGTIVVTGTLHITGNLTYPATVSDITKLPRVVIIAPKIIISPGVTQIDPWLVSTTATNSGTISTCSEVGADGGDTPLSFATAGLLTSTQCTNQLTFNGPVIADRIYLYRTYDTPTGGPAELFNLRADNFLASYVGGGPDEPVATTDNVVEVPPRF